MKINNQVSVFLIRVGDDLRYYAGPFCIFLNVSGNRREGGWCDDYYKGNNKMNEALTNALYTKRRSLRTEVTHTAHFYAHVCRPFRERREAIR